MQGDKGKAVFSLTTQFFGYGPIQGNWSPDYMFFAVGGENRVVRVLDRHGKTMGEMSLVFPGRIEAIEWDKDGESVAILQKDNTSVVVWTIATKNYNDIELSSGTGSKERGSWIKWSKTHPMLAIGTEKGSIYFFDKKTQRRIPNLGKHGKKVISGDWNDKGYLITSAEDKLVTVSDHTGKTLQSIQLPGKSALRDLAWTNIKEDGQTLPRVTAIAHSKSVCFVDVEEQKNIEVEFQSSYGKIVDYQWFEDKFILVAFSNGYISGVRSNQAEYSAEVGNKQTHNGPIEAFASCSAVNKVATVAQGVIIFTDLSNWKEDTKSRIELPHDCGRVMKLLWSGDGQILIAITNTGAVYGYLTVIPSLNAFYGQYAAILSSLSEVAIIDCARNSMVVCRLSLDIEPTFMALGPSHIAVGINNHIFYYMWQGNAQGGHTKLAFRRQFFGPVKKAVISSRWTAVLSEQRIILHSLFVDPKAVNSDDRRFPINDHEKGVSQLALTQQFLIYVDVAGRLFFFLIQDNAMVAQHRPDNLISKIFPNRIGTKCVCIDNTGNGYLYNAVTDTTCLLPNFDATTENIIWDLDDPNAFVGFSKGKLNTYLYQDGSIEGGASILHVPEYLKLSDIGQLSSGIETPIHAELKPILVKNGYVYCQSSSEKIMGTTLTSHSYLRLWPGENDTEEGHFRYFCQNIALNRFTECFKVAKFTEEHADQLYEVLGRQCLKMLEVEKAERAFQLCGNTGMSMAIGSIKHENQKMVLMGYVSMFLRKHDAAMEFFLKSSRPRLAVEMRMDLQDWEIALRLASQLVPEQEPFICRKYAGQLENQGNYIEAKKYFDQALSLGDQLSQLQQVEDRKHGVECLAGIARTSARLGDVTRAVNIASELNDQAMLGEIANVCEQMHQDGEAARLYERVQNWEKAGALYLKSRQIRQAEKLASKIESSKILSELARAKEATKLYREAEKYYERAKAWDEVIRINLEELEDFEKAKKVMKVFHPTQQSAEMIAQFCSKKGLKREAIEFYFHSGQRDRAYDMAKESEEMDIFSSLILNPSTYEDNHDEHVKVANYLESKEEFRKAAKHYERCENYSKALNLYIQAGEEAIEDAIEMVGRTRNDVHIRKLGDYLLGEHDGTPKDPRYTFKLYRAIGKKKQAEKIAVTIADQEQELGNYKYTHELLFDAFKDIRDNQLPVSFDLNHRLIILHSYVLARHMLKLQDHKAGARLLLRVAKNISQFPQHSSKILTQTVRECVLAKFRKAAYEQAVVLQRPENISKLEANYQKKMENLAKNPVEEEDEPQIITPCPFCGGLVREYETQCHHCRASIPFCVASGKHILREEYTTCPHCHSPGITSEFKRLLTVTNECPMCSKPLKDEDIVPSMEPDVEIKKLLPMKEQEDENMEEGSIDDEDDS